jgi:hypothetical protein
MDYSVFYNAMIDELEKIAVSDQPLLRAETLEKNAVLGGVYRALGRRHATREGLLGVSRREAERRGKRIVKDVAPGVAAAVGLPALGIGVYGAGKAIRKRRNG